MSRRRTMEAILASDYVSIGELARLTGCRYSTLKHYTEEGMLPFEQEEENLTRRYRRGQSVQLVEWIRQQRKDGRSVPEIKELLAEKPDTIDPKAYGKTAIAAVKELVMARMKVCGCDGKAEK